MPGLPKGQLGVRITQATEADLGLERQGYFGLNTTDIKRQREFYETLGFTGEIYPAGPETSETFAQSLGFPEDRLSTPCSSGKTRFEASLLMQT